MASGRRSVQTWLYFFSETSALKQLNTNTWQLSTLVGETTSHSYAEGEGTSARFNVISGFVQVNSTYWILVVQGNHCIRGVLKMLHCRRLVFFTTHPTWLEGAGKAAMMPQSLIPLQKLSRLPRRTDFSLAITGI